MYLVIERFDVHDANYLGVTSDLDAAKAHAQEYVDNAYDDSDLDFETALDWSPVNLDARTGPDQVVTEASDPAASVAYEIVYVAGLD